MQQHKMFKSYNSNLRSLFELNLSFSYGLHNLHKDLNVQKPTLDQNMGGVLRFVSVCTSSGTEWGNTPK
jgi:hypothetical protein